MTDGHAPSHKRRVLVACMPKSGSTFFSGILAALPGFVRAHLVPGYGRREQELCVDRLRHYEHLLQSEGCDGYVAQHHVRGSAVTRRYLSEFDIRPVVLVRNIFDVVPSLVDHHSLESHVYPAAFAPDDVNERPLEDRARFVTQMAVPWYFNFYLSWLSSPGQPLVTYEAFIADPAAVVAEVCERLDIPVSRPDVEAATAIASDSRFRRNLVTPGRGQSLPPDCIAAIHAMAAHYPGVDFRPIGIPGSSGQP
jgi:Sulfotransferase domain